MKATAQAHSNIALVKYWGKRDEKLILPYNSSVSMTLDKFFTVTTVEFDKKYKEDEFVLNGKKVFGIEAEQVKAHLDIVRSMAKIGLNAHVQSENNFPTAAGLASSASGMAALTMAAAKAAGLNLDKKELSILSRQGSGSASRSIFGGFVEWPMGKALDGRDSFGVQIAKELHWPEFRMIVCIVKGWEKKWKSRAGMTQSVATSPFFGRWAQTAEDDAKELKKAVLEKNFKKVGEIAEQNALKMHATMITTNPSIIYWHPVTVEIIQNVLQWRQEEWLEGYFTMDAGPQVKVMCLEKHEKDLVKRLGQISGIEKIEVCRAGPDAEMLDRHLF